jgi:putative membrane protein
MLLSWLVHAVVLLLLTELLPRIHVRSFFAALGAAVLIGLVSSTLGLVLQFLALPITFLTLGLFSWVVSGAMFLLAGKLWSGFRVDGFWTAFFGSLGYTLISDAVLRAL